MSKVIEAEDWYGNPYKTSVKSFVVATVDRVDNTEGALECANRRAETQQQRLVDVLTQKGILNLQNIVYICGHWSVTETNTKLVES